jgi:hypothetical protein
VREYVIQNGLDLRAPLSVPGYPALIERPTGGCRNNAGVAKFRGIATIHAVTSTISQAARTAPIGIRKAEAKGVLRGVSFTPGTGSLHVGGADGSK